ncbi:MAG TPA: MFS transporter [Nitrososphaera sp.]|jgi:MFS family permease|nr:MFS transporter [Nitrososphaera sp.]
MRKMTRVEKQTNINRSAWTTLVILSCLGLITMYGETMVLPAIPDFIRDFNISYSTSSWILSSYLIAGAVMTPIAGRLSDIYGKKKILLIVMAVYSTGILAGGFANSIEFMLTARAAQGVGMSMFPIAFGIIREILPEKKLAIGQTIFSSTFSGGAVVGLMVGATIIQNFGWQATFFSIFPIAVMLGLVIRRIIHVRDLATSEVKVKEGGKEGGENDKNSSIKTQTIDLKGTLALAVTIISFLAGISFLENNSNEAGFQVAGLFSIAAVSLAVFIIIEKKVSSPLVDLKLMTHKMILPATIILMMVFLCMFMVYQTIPILVRSPQPLGFGGDAVVTASVQLPFMIVLLIGTVMSGFILNKVGNTRLTLLGTIISAIGFFSLLLFHSTEFMVSVTLTIISAGLSLSITGGFNVVLLSAPIQATGIALGMALLLNLVGMSIGPTIAAMFQQMYQGTVEGVAGEQFPTQDAYNLIFLTAALISLASIALALALARRKIIVGHIPSTTPTQ